MQKWRGAEGTDEGLKLQTRGGGGLDETENKRGIRIRGGERLWERNGWEKRPERRKRAVKKKKEEMKEGREGSPAHRPLSVPDGRLSPSKTLPCARPLVRRRPGDPLQRPGSKDTLRPNCAPVTSLLLRVPSHCEPRKVCCPSSSIARTPLARGCAEPNVAPRSRERRPS